MNISSVLQIIMPQPRIKWMKRINSYQPQRIEKKWQNLWSGAELYRADISKAQKPFYNLMMFPYPSGEGLHVGHMYAFSGADVYGRFQRLQGQDVFEPMGFDAFGIHSENYALKVGIHPRQLIDKTTKRYREQLESIGAMFDWSRSLNTTDPSYYRWTQWLFLQLFKAGLAERKAAAVNWCPSCLTVLADEQVIHERCERCDAEVTKKYLKQWFFKITNYSQRLLDNLKNLDWSQRVKAVQRNWIGRQEGALIKFKLNGSNELIEVFTTRPDTLFGATFIAVSPRHKFIEKKFHGLPEKVKKFISRQSSTAYRHAEGPELLGYPLGLEVIHPITGQKLPIWVTNYVLMEYATGAIMGVPAHDERDFRFAKKFGLPLKKVIEPEALTRFVRNPEDIASGAPQDLKLGGELWEGEGRLINSGRFTGLSSQQGRQKIVQWLKNKSLGGPSVSYRLRDWLISRQRYWGPPIPIVYCRKCWEGSNIKNQESRIQEGIDFTIIDGREHAIVPVPEEELPVELPYIKEFKPLGTGRSPLAGNPGFYKTKCPQCKSPATRETDVSDTFLDSSWYYLGYLILKDQGPKTKNQKFELNQRLIKKWLPVDMYIGGAEHSVLHLLYARFITMALHDLGHLPFEEPFSRFRVHGLLIKDGAKMSKSRGNVVVPDKYIKAFGVDIMRLYLLFLGPFQQGGDFRDDGIVGMERFLNRVWRLTAEFLSKRNKDVTVSPATARIRNLTIKRVGEDIASLKYNTAIAALMEYLNHLSDFSTKICGKDVEVLLILLSPFAPHISEELWHQLNQTQPSPADLKKTSIFSTRWPVYDPKLIKQDEATIIVQINGKMRSSLRLPAGADQDTVSKQALKDERIKRWLADPGKIKKTIFIKDRLINFVV